MSKDLAVFIGYKSYYDGMRHKNINLSLSRDNFFFLLNSSPDEENQRLRERILKELNMTEREEKHAKFFNHEEIFISSLGYDDLMAHIQELEDIAFEAKARLSSAHGKKRRLEADMTKEQRDKLVDNPSILVSDAISTVQKRKDRMTKAEKLREQLVGLGLDEEAIKAAMANIKVDETSQAIANNAKNYQFKSSNPPPDTPEEPLVAVGVKTPDKPIKPSTEEVKEPFDPSKLFG